MHGQADWWPEDWTEPVGYHATIPCKKEETGYRVFDNVFAIDRGLNDDSVVVIKYMHSMLRDQEAYHNRFGTAGFCRSGSYSSPQYMTNTMRICTKDAVDVSYDATVPVKPKWNDPSKKYSDDEYCSTSSEDVPWSMVSLLVCAFFCVWHRSGLFIATSIPLIQKKKKII